MSPLCKYFHLLTTLLDGGRWKVLAFSKWKLKEDAVINDTVLTPVARDTAWLALIEEILETIGGIFMSTDVIWLSPGNFEVACFFKWLQAMHRVPRKLDRVRCCWNCLLLLMARQVLFSQCGSRKNQGQRSWFRYRRYYFIETWCPKRYKLRDLSEGEEQLEYSIY